MQPVLPRPKHEMLSAQSKADSDTADPEQNNEWVQLVHGSGHTVYGFEADPKNARIHEQSNAT